MRRLGFRADPSLAFEFRLAERLGKTVRELRASMTPAEMAGWMALEVIGGD